MLARLLFLELQPGREGHMWETHRARERRLRAHGRLLRGGLDSGGIADLAVVESADQQEEEGGDCDPVEFWVVVWRGGVGENSVY